MLPCCSRGGQVMHLKHLSAGWLWANLQNLEQNSGPQGNSQVF